MLGRSSEISETAITAAFRAAGQSDAERLRLAVVTCSETKAPSASLWGKLVKDRALALAAMDLLIRSIAPIATPRIVRGVIAAPTNSDAKAARDARVREEAARLVGKAKKDVVVGILRTTKTADGRPWAEVGYHELPSMARDGSIAGALLAELPKPSNQFASVGELISDANFGELLQKMRVCT